MSLNLFSDGGLGLLEPKLANYSNGKLTHSTNLAGQFLDEEGVKDNQHGIFGTSIFCIVSSKSKIFDVVNLRRSCIEQLREWINEANSYDINNEPNNTNAEDRTGSLKSHVYEIRNVIPKMCFAYEACLYNQQLGHEKNLLEGFIHSSQKKDGGFGFLCTGTESHVVTTALVLRMCLSHHPGNPQTNSALLYLLDSFENMTNLFEKLYVMNSIQLVVNAGNNSCHNRTKLFHKRIANTVKELMKTLTAEPTSFGNPINIDYKDNTRNRFYRIYSDVILLEALALADLGDLAYLRGSKSEKMLNRLHQSLKADANKDTSFHRLSFPFCHTAYTFADIISKSYEPKLGLLTSMKARLKRLELFGIDWGKEGYITACTLPFLIAWFLLNFFLTKYTEFTIASWFNIAVSFLLTRFSNVFSLKYEKNTGK